MGRKAQPQVIYQPMPAPMGAGQPSQDQMDFTKALQEQMSKLQEQYNAQVRSLNDQYNSNSTSTSSILAQLQQQLASQQQLSTQAAAELAKAREASSAQLSLMEGMRNAQQAQLSDARQEQTNYTGSLLSRLNRKRQARSEVYSA